MTSELMFAGLNPRTVMWRDAAAYYSQLPELRRRDAIALLGDDTNHGGPTQRGAG